VSSVDAHDPASSVGVGRQRVDRRQHPSPVEIHRQRSDRNARLDAREGGEQRRGRGDHDLGVGTEQIDARAGERAPVAPVPRDDADPSVHQAQLE
jgi:hypothetical protein